VWNGLPDFVSFTSIAAFKMSIGTVDFSEFLMCNNVESPHYKGQLLALHMQPCCPACTFYCE